MNDAGSITMTMRALDRLKVIQRVADGNLKPGQAAGRLGLTVRQVRRLVRRYEAQGATGLVHLVIHKSRIFHSKGLNCGSGIHSALKSDPEGFCTGLAIALATKEAA